jgi:hypothetical protein
MSGQLEKGEYGAAIQFADSVTSAHVHREYNHVEKEGHNQRVGYQKKCTKLPSDANPLSAPISVDGTPESPNVVQVEKTLSMSKPDQRVSGPTSQNYSLLGLATSRSIDSPYNNLDIDRISMSPCNPVVPPLRGGEMYVNDTSCDTPIPRSTHHSNPAMLTGTKGTLASDHIKVNTRPVDRGKVNSNPPTLGKIPRTFPEGAYEWADDLVNKHFTTTPADIVDIGDELVALTPNQLLQVRRLLLEFWMVFTDPNQVVAPVTPSITANIPVGNARPIYNPRPITNPIHKKAYRGEDQIHA